MASTVSVSMACQQNEAENESLHTVEIDQSMQSCSGNILSKLQCIRLPEPDSAGDIAGIMVNESGLVEKPSDTQENIEKDQLADQTDMDNIQHFIENGERHTQGCSGGILSTFQCIKMPLPDSDASSLSSVEPDDVLPVGTSGLHTSNPLDSTFSGSSMRESFKSFEDVEVGSAISQSDHVTSRCSNCEAPNRGTDGVKDINTSPKRMNSMNDLKTHHQINDESDAENTYAEVSPIVNVDPFDEYELNRLHEREQHRIAREKSLSKLQCEVCLEAKLVQYRNCCKTPICAECLESFINIQIEQAIVKIPCPSATCKEFIHRHEILDIISGDVKDKYNKFLVDANQDPFVKTCPRCSTVMTVEPSLIKAMNIKRKGVWLV